MLTPKVDRKNSNEENIVAHEKKQYMQYMPICVGMHLPILGGTIHQRSYPGIRLKVKTLSSFLLLI